jgi:hypothetical protein
MMPFQLSLLSRLGLWGLVLSVLGCLGCSGSDGLNVVRGRVLSKNGEPAKGVVLTFHLKGADPVKAVRPIGLTTEDGTFTLMTGNKDGAAVGEYAVTLIWPEEPKTKGIPRGPTDSRDRLEGAYANPAAPRFKAEIKQGENTLEPFKLK